MEKKSYIKPSAFVLTVNDELPIASSNQTESNNISSNYSSSMNALYTVQNIKDSFSENNIAWEEEDNGVNISSFDKKIDATITIHFRFISPTLLNIYATQDNGNISEEDCARALMAVNEYNLQQMRVTGTLQIIKNFPMNFIMASKMFVLDQPISQEYFEETILRQSVADVIDFFEVFPEYFSQQ